MTDQHPITPPPDLLHQWATEYRGNPGESVQYAIRSGKLQKSSACICQDCGKAANQYHHEDYSKPLDVIPLCKHCHIQRHD